LPVSKQQNPAPVSPARLVFLAALTVLVALVVWVAVRAVGPSTADAAGPTVVLPSVSTVPVGAAEPQSPSPTISLLPPPSSSPTPSHSRSASPSTSAARHSASAPASSSPTPHVSHTSAKPVPKAAFSATVSTSSAWGGGYVGTVTVTNTGNKAGTWSLSVTHGSVSGLRLYTTWNAHGSQQGSTFAFSAGSLAPGQSASFGYEAGARTHTTLRPSGCSVASGSCRVS
jgi:hypothetical protein